MTSGHWVLTDINPEPWTSPEASVGKRGGKFTPRLYKGETLRAYQGAVAEDIKRIYDPAPLTIDLEVSFLFWRELDTPRSRIADATNLQKALEDALPDLLYENDRQVKRVHSTVVDQRVDINPMIVIIWRPFLGTDYADVRPWLPQYNALGDRKAEPTNETGINPTEFF